MSSPQQQIKPKMAVVGRTQQDLLRLVSALSGACRADRNVLKDSQLVDLLEAQAKAILQTRRQQQRRKSVAAPTISPQRTKLIKKFADANAESALSKRRKLSFETETHKCPASPIKPRSFNKAGVVDLYGKNPAADYGVPQGATSVSVFNAAIVNHMVQRSGAVSPQQFYKSGGNNFKSLDRSSVDLDLTASMASTVVSTSAGYYDDMYDDMSPSRYRRRYDSPGLDSRGRGSPCSDLTQSVDSIDWSPSDDEEEHELSPIPSSKSESKPHVSFNMTVDADAAAVVVSSEMKSSTEVVMQVLYGIMHHDENYKWLVDPENQARVAKLVEFYQLQQNGSAASSATSSPSEELQAHVDELIRENARIQSENARLLEVNQMTVCDVEEQKKQVHELLLNLQSSMSATNNNNKTVTSSPSDLERRLADSQEQLAAQETCRREAELMYESELEAKSQTVASLKQELLGKDDEVSSLMKQVEAISAAHASKTLERCSFDGSASFSSSMGFRRSSLSPQEPVDADESMILHLREVNVARETEVKRLRAVLMDKDREICNLYMHLSTKKKLVEEISSRILQQVQAITGESPITSLDDLNLNLDMFLFKNVVDKQKSVDELTAALGVMEREVEKLEERVEHFESENYTLKVTQEDTVSTLESANSEFMRVSAENELMETSLKEKQTRIRNLMLYLEEKEDQIMRLKDSAEQLRFAR